MKRLTITICTLLSLSTAVNADNGQTVYIGGSAVDKYATQLTFDGNNVVLTFEDGTTQTADMATVSINLTYNSDPSGIENVITDCKTEGRVFSISGQYLGNSTEKLSKGLYIIDGKKVVIK